ncbi:MAG: hypothetical protein WBM57_11955 [Woeseiaceae bacterium]
MLSLVGPEALEQQECDRRVDVVQHEVDDLQRQPSTTTFNDNQAMLA